MAAKCLRLSKKRAVIFCHFLIFAHLVHIWNSCMLVENLVPLELSSVYSAVLNSVMEPLRCLFISIIDLFQVICTSMLQHTY